MKASSSHSVSPKSGSQLCVAIALPLLGAIQILVYTQSHRIEMALNLASSTVTILLFSTMLITIATQLILLVTILLHRQASGFPSPNEENSSEAIRVQESSKILCSLIVALSDSLQSQLTNSTAYGDFLKDAVDELSSNPNQQKMQVLVTRLVAENLAMKQRSTAFELELKTSNQAITELKQNLLEASQELMKDPLTAVGNRKFLDQKLGESMDVTARTGKTMCFALVDIDHFKRVNDVHGHLVGDHILKLFAKTIGQNLKGKDSIARFGGEEFAIILPETTLPQAMSFMDQIRIELASKNWVIADTGQSIGTVTASIGLAELRRGEKPASFIQRADKALYSAKGQGRNQVCAAPDGGEGESSRPARIRRIA